MYIDPFMPPNLPPQLELAGLIRLLTDTRDLVARYDESVSRLPNPDLIRRSFETQEAVLSSRIEGNQASLMDVFEYDAKNARDRITDKQKDYEEIINYRLALKEGHRHLKRVDISIDLIKELHSVLLRPARGEAKGSGDFRRNQVYIGRPGATIKEATYIPPPHTEVSRLMENLLRYMDTDHSESDTLIQAAIAHYQFEAIHPFEDGNGRIGRLLISLYLYKQGLTRLPNLYISEFFERYRREYYESLNLVSKERDWLNWITFFLRAVREQARISNERVGRIESLYKELSRDLPKFNSKYAPVFLEALFKSPIFSLKGIAAIAGIKNQPTAYSLLNKFLDAGLVSYINGDQRARHRIMVFDRLLEILS